MIASGNGVGGGVGVGTGVAVGLGVGVGETEGGGLNFGPGQPARKMQARSNGNFPILPPATLRVAMRAGQRSNTPTLPPFEDEDDDEFEDESKLLGRWLRNRMDLLLVD